MKNGYIRILLNVAILLALLVAMDIIVGWTGEKYMKWLNKLPRNGDAALVNYNVNAVKPDVAILGSSTAICHYDPDMIHDSLLAITGEDLQVFNMGVSNQRLAWDYYGIKCLLDRTTPKIVIVDVWASFLGEGDPSFSFGAFKPYANMNPNIKEMLKKHGQFNYSMNSNMYCFNTELVKLLLSSLKAKGSNGFITSDVMMSNINKGLDPDTTSLLPLSVEEFDSMILLAKEYKFKLFVVMSPTLRSSDTLSLSYKYIKSKCQEEGIPFMDYSNDTNYYKKELFRDPTHMNYYGAELFTKELMKDIIGFVQ